MHFLVKDHQQFKRADILQSAKYWMNIVLEKDLIQYYLAVLNISAV